MSTSIPRKEKDRIFQRLDHKGKQLNNVKVKLRDYEFLIITT